MKKLILTTIAVAAITASTSAFAGWYDAFGYDHPVCTMVFTPYGWVQSCF